MKTPKIRRSERLKQEKEVKELVQNRIASYIKNPQDQQDVAQDVYMKMCENQAKYEEQGKLKAWSSRVSRNVSVSFLRQQNKLKTCSFDDMAVEMEGNVDTRITIQRLHEEALHELAQKLISNEIDDVKFHISKDFIVYGMSKRSIKIKEHVGNKKLKRVMDESRVYLLQRVAEIRKEYEKEGCTIEE